MDHTTFERLRRRRRARAASALAALAAAGTVAGWAYESRHLAA